MPNWNKSLEAMFLDLWAIYTRNGVIYGMISVLIFIT